MEEYKSHLCTYIKQDCVSDTIYDCIKDDSRYMCNLNEEGKLHSEYMGSYYRPAIIYTGSMYTDLFWLFNGEIKDCPHPFYIRVADGQIDLIVYYSSERIKTNQAIYIYYSDVYTYTYYNTYVGHQSMILQNTNYRTGGGSMCNSIDIANKYDKSLFTSELYPFCDEMDVFKFKLEFVD